MPAALDSCEPPSNCGAAPPPWTNFEPASIPRSVLMVSAATGGISELLQPIAGRWPPATRRCGEERRLQAPPWSQCPTAGMRCDEWVHTAVGGNTGLAGHATGSFAAMAPGTAEPEPEPGLDGRGRLSGCPRWVHTRSSRSVSLALRQDDATPGPCPVGTYASNTGQFGLSATYRMQ